MVEKLHRTEVLRVDAKQKVARQNYLEEKCEELENIESTLQSLIEDIEDKKYKELLTEIIIDTQNEREMLETELREYHDKEKEELEREYWDSQF